MSVAARLQRVQERIAAAAARAGRDPAGVTLVAVSKTFPPSLIAEAVAAGVTDLGENRAQELKQKHAVLGGIARWHFVGNLQTNKVRHVVGIAALVHSVDRYGLAEAIARRARSLGVVQDVLIEVNVTGEPTKHGVEPPRLAALAEALRGLPGIAVRGLMTMAPLSPDPEDARPVFKELARLRDELPGEGPFELSMGMSGDFEVAVEEGATLVRIGEAIFGPRR